MIWLEPLEHIYKGVLILGIFQFQNQLDEPSFMFAWRVVQIFPFSYDPFRGFYLF